MRFAKLNTPPPPLKSASSIKLPRGLSREFTVCILEVLVQNLQKVVFEVVNCDIHSSLVFLIRDAYLYKVKDQLNRTAYHSCHSTDN